MPAISGSAMYLAWIYTGGTVRIDTDYRQFDYAPTLSIIDASAGADTFREYIGGIGEGGAISVSCVLQSGGTAFLSSLATNTAGTLVYGPMGTATGQPKTTIPALSKGPAYSQKYDDVIEVKVEFQQTAAATQAAF